MEIFFYFFLAKFFLFLIKDEVNIIYFNFILYLKTLSNSKNSLSFLFLRFILSVRDLYLIIYYKYLEFNSILLTGIAVLNVINFICNDMFNYITLCKIISCVLFMLSLFNLIYFNVINSELKDKNYGIYIIIMLISILLLLFTYDTFIETITMLIHVYMKGKGKGKAMKSPSHDPDPSSRPPKRPRPNNDPDITENPNKKKKKEKHPGINTSKSVTKNEPGPSNAPPRRDDYNNYNQSSSNYESTVKENTTRNPMSLSTILNEEKVRTPDSNHGSPSSYSCYSSEIHDSDTESIKNTKRKLKEQDENLRKR